MERKTYLVQIEVQFWKSGKKKNFNFLVIIGIFLHALNQNKKTKF